MKQVSLGIILSFLLLLSLPVQLAQSQSNGGELSGLVKDWLSATGKGDREALERLIDEQFIGTSFGGNLVRKADILPADGADEHQRPKLSLVEFTSQLLGNTGIVMGRVDVEGPGGPGPFRFTAVFLRRDQGWKMVAAHLSRVEK